MIEETSSFSAEMIAPTFQVVIPRGFIVLIGENPNNIDTAAWKPTISVLKGPETNGTPHTPGWGWNNIPPPFFAVLLFRKVKTVKQHGK